MWTAHFFMEPWRESFYSAVPVTTVWVTTLKFTEPEFHTDSVLLLCVPCGEKTQPPYRTPWPGLGRRGERNGIPGSRWLGPGGRPAHWKDKYSLGSKDDTVGPVAVAKVGCNPSRSPKWLSLSQNLWKTQNSWQKNLSQSLEYTPVTANSRGTLAGP